MEEERALAVQQAVDESVSLKLKKLQVRLEKMEKENQDLKELNKCLIENQKIYQQRMQEFEERELKSVKERDDKIADLEEQVRDFMLFIEAQKLLETSGNGGELRDGSVLALPVNLGPSKSSSRISRQGKKKR